ncbi:MAG: hypothetical protein ACREQN_01760 [Candidatus Binataceae bacterium]
MATARKSIGTRKTRKRAKPRTAVKPETLRLLRKVRKPLAPPTRVEDDPHTYSRARARERIRREHAAERDPTTGSN